MTPTLLVCDLDGTLTFAPRAPEEVVLDVLRALAETDGVRLAIATARSARTVQEWFPELLGRLEVVCCNGALTLGTDEVPRFLPRASLAIAVRRLARAGAAFCLEYGTHFVASERGALPWMGQAHRALLPSGARPDVRRVLKCSVADASAARRAANRLPGIVVLPHGSGDADLMASHVSKAAAVSRLQRPGERLVALGNDVNDLALLRSADVGIVVGDGLGELDAVRHVRRVRADPGTVAAALVEVTSVAERFATASSAR